jgi:hypothetical protein
MKYLSTPIRGRRGGLLSALAAPHVFVSRVPDSMRICSRGYTRDAFDPMAFQFRMGAGFYGDVNRTHPFWVEPGPVDPTNPPTAYGQAVVIDATSKKVRRVISSDTALISVWGFTVRPFPFQDGGAAGAFGAQTLGGFTTPLTNQPIDVMRSGYMITYVNGTPGKGDPLYVWCAASSTVHYQGFLEATSPAGNGFLLSPVGTYGNAFNGPPDANGAGEIIFHA